MRKRLLSVFLLLCAGRLAAQQPAVPKPAVDSIAYYDALFDDMAEFLDSITAPRTFLLADVGLSSAYFNYLEAGAIDLEPRRQTTWTPSIGYYHKNGLGLVLNSTLVSNGASLKAYQHVATASYDYLKQDAFATGVSYARFFTKKELSFYTTPLQNEVGAYVTYKKWWLRPALYASYGWGSRSAYDERETYIQRIRLRDTGVIRVQTNEVINDFSLSLSLRRDFYFLNILLPRSSLRLTPQLVFSAGTQKFGFNQNASTFGIVRGTDLNELVSTEYQTLDDQLRFQPLSATALLRAEWSWKRFFLQPQYVLNYYFPSSSSNLAGYLRVNFGYLYEF
ncbi:MAG: hypothetical protein EOO12_10420 [Chitinophagaceae bacterium]|nr:MAG: hypothetical protein EOO12_10420 [Chitinophagaceae bacterium]